MTKPLKPYEHVFVQEYIKTSNATQSYQLARPEVTNNTARNKGSQMVAQGYIQEAIDQAVNKGTDKSISTRSKVLDRLWDLSDDAKDAKQYGSSVNAVREYAKIEGLYSEPESSEGYIQVIQSMVHVTNTVNAQVIINKEIVPDTQSGHDFIGPVVPADRAGDQADES